MVSITFGTLTSLITFQSSLFDIRNIHFVTDQVLFAQFFTDVMLENSELQLNLSYSIETKQSVMRHLVIETFFVSSRYEYMSQDIKVQ